MFDFFAQLQKIQILHIIVAKIELLQILEFEEAS